MAILSPDSDYHYVNGGHDILIIGFSWFYGRNAGGFDSDLNYSYEYTSDWGSHVLNNYHLSNDGSSFSSYCLLVGGEDDWGGTTECGIFINDTNVDPAVASWWGSPTGTKQFSGAYKVTGS